MQIFNNFTTYFFPFCRIGSQQQSCNGSGFQGTLLCKFMKISCPLSTGEEFRQELKKRKEGNQTQQVMSKTEEEEQDIGQNVKVKFDELCRTLNMDKDTEDKAWSSYIKNDRNFTLEGESLHWLACALYVSCRKSNGPESKKQGYEGNGISLSKLLGAVKLSLLHFFQKVRKWLDMSKSGKNLHEKIDQLERNFSVSSVVFEKFAVVFKEIFKEDWSEPSKRGRKKQALTSTDIVNFCWTLYIRAKAMYPDISDDLVNSYHLLLCCIDLVFANIMGVKHLKTCFNASFSGLPEDYLTYEYNANEIPSIIDTLCQLHAGLAIETKIIKRQYLKTFIEEEIREGHLKGSIERLSGLADAGHFEYNMKSMNDSYEEHILRTGDIDERIFIMADSDFQIGTPTKQWMFGESVDEKERSQVKRNLQEYFNKVKGFPPQTPLTGRRWVRDKEETSSSTYSSITFSVGRLQESLKGLKPEPSVGLIDIFKSFKENPASRLKEQVDQLSAKFVEKYNAPLHNGVASPSSGQNFTEARLKLGTALFYKVLQSIIEAERKRSSADKDLSPLFEQDVFIKSLLACCLEIVIYSYNSSKTFPWILNVFNLSAYHFFKVIEVVIREEDSLSRDVIKHLSRVEEQILEKLAWQTGSPIYAAMEVSGIPQCKEVATDSNVAPSYFIMSPQPLRPTKDASTQKSPILTLSDRFGAQLGSPARRNLFGTNKEGQQKLSDIRADTAIVLPPRTGTNLATQPLVKFPIMINSAGNSPVRLVAVTPPKGTPPRPGMIRISSPSKNTKRYGSLGIFFRKLYHMMSLRMKDLCEKLNIAAVLQHKIWTCFEHSLLKNSDMLRDRHVDQLLMCAIYVMSKVTKDDKSFHEIMKFYRTQPQASSDVYRQVLIERASDREAELASSTSSARNPAISVHLPAKEEATTSDISSENRVDQAESSESKSSEEMSNKSVESSLNESEILNKEAESSMSSLVDKNVYNDLIQFYNIVYIRKIKEFALKFASSKVNLDAPPLSPLPVTRRQVHSPRKVSKKHEVYISPIKPSTQMTPRSRLLYCFDSSPARKLRDINEMIKGSMPGGTRRRVILDNDQEDGPSAAKRQPYMNGVQRLYQNLKQDIKHFNSINK